MRSAASLTLILTPLLLTGCALNTLAHQAGKTVAIQAATHSKAPAARPEAKLAGGTFCESMKQLGWPLVPSAEAAVGIMALPRQVKEPIIAAQEFGFAECVGWNVGTPKG